MSARVVRSAAELAEAISEGTEVVEVVGTITGAPMITLPPGVTLRGGALEFGAKGIRLTRDNTLEGVTIRTAEHEVAVLNDTRVEDLGALTLRDVTVRGQVFIVAEDNVRAGHVQIAGLRVTAADVRGRARRPHGFGVDAMQGALTVWNRQPDPSVVITAEASAVTAGSEQEPIRGSGVFLGGHGDWAGRGDGGILRVSRLTTGAIYTDGGIATHTPDLISGGVFVISGAEVEQVETQGPVTTRGQNDMVLDNWGRVRAWTVTGAVTSHGPSGIGFVNFGDIDLLDVRAPIRTTGAGARGFNLYDGSLRDARFASIETTGDGSVGIQVSKPLGTLTVAGDVTTTGGEGMSLVKGVQVMLPATALSVKPGGAVDRIDIGGRLATSGDRVTTLEVAGTLKELAVAGGIHATGRDSDAAHLGTDGPDLSMLEVRADHGRTVVII